MNRLGKSVLFNVLSMLMLCLTALACLYYSTVFFVPAAAGRFGGPPNVNPTIPPAPTFTPTSPWAATWTPSPTSPPPDTPTPFVTNTPGPTDTPVTFVLTRTPTARVSPTPKAKFTPYIFKYEGSATLRPSPINPCGASYIAGTVTDLDGNPLTTSGLIVHVEGDADIDTGFALHPGEQFRGKRVEGRSPFIGILNDPSAWSVVINQAGTSAGTWQVWLIQNGQASNKVQVRLESECAGSSAMVRFQQNH